MGVLPIRHRQSPRLIWARIWGSWKQEKKFFVGEERDSGNWRRPDQRNRGLQWVANMEKAVAAQTAQLLLLLLICILPYVRLNLARREQGGKSINLFLVIGNMPGS